MTFEKKRVLLSLMLTAALAMPESAFAVAAKPGCSVSDKKCEINVLVSGTAVTFDPDEAHVKQNQLGNKYKITFNLPNSGFQFKKGDGVFFKDPVNGEFVSCGVVKGKKKWRCTYNNTVLGKYRYKVTFHDTAGGPLMGDPVITNIDTN